VGDGGSVFVGDRPAEVSAFEADFEFFSFEFELRDGVLFHQINDGFDVFQVHRVLRVEKYEMLCELVLIRGERQRDGIEQRFLVSKWAEPREGGVEASSGHSAPRGSAVGRENSRAIQLSFNPQAPVNCKAA
jgi:hypothetical protein